MSEHLSKFRKNPKATLFALALGLFVGIFMVVFVNNVIYPAFEAVWRAKTYATFDTEFADFIGEGRAITSIHNYVTRTASEDFAVFHGPLFSLRGYNLIVGKSGTVALVTYQQESDGTLQPNGLHSEEAKAYVLVISDFVAPEEWRGRSITTVHANTTSPIPIKSATGDPGSTTVPEGPFMLISLETPNADSSGNDIEDTMPSGIYWAWDGQGYRTFKVTYIAYNTTQTYDLPTTYI